jgi:ribose 5-phosphate isomerase B
MHRKAEEETAHESVLGDVGNAARRSQAAAQQAGGGRTRPRPGGGCCGGGRSARLAPVRVYIGSDHAGFELKAAIAEWLAGAGHEPVDCGPPGLDEADDYPPYVMRAADAVVGDPGSLGVVIGGSGNGEQIAANKIRGVRAALAWNQETARLARQHNDANVLSLGAREQPIAEALGFVEVFVATPFSGEARHARRLAMIAEYEATGKLPPLPGS